MQERKHHYFLALKLPMEIKSFLQRWIEVRQQEYPFLKWVHKEDYHITLVFLGDVDEQKRKQLIEKVKKITSTVSSFTLTLSKLGVFGNMKKPRIFWAGVNESCELKDVQKKLFEDCLEMGFSLDMKPFNPHITIARKWGDQVECNVEKLTKITNDKGQSITFPITEIVLYETHSTEIPKYKEYAIFPLC